MPLLSYEIQASEASPGTRLHALVDLGFPCNLTCPGCARGRQRGRPARATLFAIAEQLAVLVEEVVAAAVSVVLFGGEPMLDLDAVVATSARVWDSCARVGCGYEGAVITNALLLDGYAARRLARAGIGMVQVTLPSRPRGADGAHAAIDVQRVARVVRNVREAREEVGLLIRCEVDGTEELREALTVVRVLEREGVFAPPRPATMLLGPRSTYAAQARAIFASPPARATTGVTTRCP